MAENFFTYKGKPLVRFKNTIYFGDMAEDYVVMLQILGSEKLGDMDLTNKVSLKLMLTDETKNPLERIVKSSEKQGLYEALDIADVWLSEALKNK